MVAMPEVIEKPLTRQELAERFRAMCVDPRFTNLPGKIELDVWGAMKMSPASNLHGLIKFELGRRLYPLGGKVLIEASVSTSAGVLVADVAWASSAFMQAHRAETPFTSAPEICIEVASPSNSLRELRDKMAAYIEARASEAWIAYPQSKRVEFFAASGPLERSGFDVDLVGLFD